MTDMEYERIIRLYDYKKLVRLGTNVKEGKKVKDWSAGKAFEYLVIRGFELENDRARVRYSYSVSIGELVFSEEKMAAEQIDGAIYLEGLSFLVECKDRSENIDIETIAKLRNQLLRRPAGVIGIVFSRTAFTDAAVRLARFVSPQAILLVTGAEIDAALRGKYLCEGLIAKYRACVEKGMPDYNIERGLK